MTINLPTRRPPPEALGVALWFAEETKRERSNISVVGKNPS
jgi:hypothetical protein